MNGAGGEAVHAPDNVPGWLVLVCAYVLNWIREHGITVDDEKLDALIEAAVYELTNNGLLAIEQGVIVGEDDGHEAG